LIFLDWFTYTSIGILRYFLMRRQGWLGWWQLMLMWGVA
jgi:ABC-type tungstate transport system substrate-binding protein